MIGSLVPEAISKKVGHREDAGRTKSEPVLLVCSDRNQRPRAHRYWRERSRGVSKLALAERAARARRG